MIVALAACASDGSDSSRPAPVEHVPVAAPGPEPGCEVPAGPPELGEDLVALRAAVLAEAPLASAPAYQEFVRSCDRVDATTAVIPAEWAERSPGPDDVPRAGLTAGPDFESRVEDQPVVWTDAVRFVGDAVPLRLVNYDNARGTLADGTRVPRVGTAIPNACRPLEPVSVRIGGGDLEAEVQPYVHCEGDERVWLVSAGYPVGGGRYRTLVIGQALDQADLDALLVVLATFEVDDTHIPPVDAPPLPSVPS